MADLQTAKANPAKAYASGSLSGSLSTINKSGYCGPTSAHCVLKYEGKLRGGAYNNTSEIVVISTYTGVGVSIFSLTAGVQAYMDTYGISGYALWVPYSWSSVVNKINSNKPITLGTSGGGIATGGHVRTIHKYFNTGNDYLLYVNDSWGNNNVTIAYNTTYSGPPSYLSDHMWVS